MTLTNSSLNFDLLHYFAEHHVNNFLQSDRKCCKNIINMYDLLTLFLSCAFKDIITNLLVVHQYKVFYDDILVI